MTEWVVTEDFIPALFSWSINARQIGGVEESDNCRILARGFPDKDSAVTAAKAVHDQRTEHLRNPR